MDVTRRSRRGLIAVIASIAVAAGSLFGASTANAAPPPPAVMASLGDSITQAAMTCSNLLSCPTNSWSTGSTASVKSHATRLKASVAPGLVAYNDAVSAVTSSALLGQAQNAVAQGAQYVTIEIGANDACASTVSAMTPTATYDANVRAALAALAGSAAHPQIFVASIPSLQRMYDLNKSSLSARLAWGLLQVCQSMLANPTSTKTADVQRRAAVQQRVNDYNAVLAAACTATANCRFDGNAVATYAFSKADISTRDYFHPSLSGQATLAAITWAKTQWVS